MSDLVLPFGPHEGRTIGDVASSGGMGYLRWLRDTRRSERSDGDLTDLDRALDDVVGD